MPDFTDFLTHGHLPLSEGRWRELNLAVVEVARRRLVGRRFLDLYGRPNRLTLPERNKKANIGQALHMLAGQVFNEKLSAPQGRLQQWIHAGKTESQIVTDVFMAAYVRQPAADELLDIQRMIAARPDREEALKDFVWAILSSREFAENH